ncbi:Transcriptional regulator, AraC family OS=Tsukamurella paurometabola (strain ATCC 8368 / DSM/ CCUG 35730 / CIP 100753 / JCM 10117 / KCTC 9821 / NBRC 16120/ NCIMB 702349 / NCTC 13040) OX=521096 GN=Tpau_1519 PE=4 SV=1 [Tsukamurella paurometabola]|nr:Colonization factor antigen I subunit D [Tsukamurella paurometabola]
MVAYLIERLGREGHPVRAWADRAGIARIDRLSGLRLTFPQTVAFITEAVRAAPDRPLGLQVGARPLLQSFGMVGVAVQTADGLAAAVGIGLRLHEEAGSLVDFTVAEDARTVSVGVLPRSDVAEILPFLCEETLLSSLTLVRSALADEDLAPIGVELAYPAPSYADVYDDVFGCPVRFDAPRTAVTIPGHLLDLPLPGRQPAVHAAAVAACRGLIGTDDADELDHVWAVEQLLRADLARAATIATVARHLRTTERTLRRRLSDGGESFRSIHNRVRRERAESLLRSTSMPIGEVAAAVGFADARDFRRAFRAWTGRTPADLRGSGDGSVSG